MKSYEVGRRKGKYGMVMIGNIHQQGGKRAKQMVYKQSIYDVVYEAFCKEKASEELYE